MIVIAHRGASWDAPENTLEAFDLACEQGADYVEFDVRAAPDDRLVIAHDPVRKPPLPTVPTLDETLAALSGRVGLAVEIKEQAVVEATIAALERHRVEAADLLILSFRIRALEQARRRRPESARGSPTRRRGRAWAWRSSTATTSARRLRAPPRS